MRNKLRPILVLTALLLVVIGAYLGLKKLKVRTISCVSQFGPCSADLSGQLDGFGDLAIVDAVTAIKKNLASQSKISQYSIRYSLPGSLHVFVVEKKGEVALGQQGFDGFIILDKEADVIDLEKSTSLPVINVNSGQALDFKPGSKVDNNLVFAEQIARNVFAAYGIKLTILYNDRIEIKLEGGPKVIFPTAGEVDVLMGSLSLILSHLNNASSEIRMGEIDLRYKNPVIR